LGVTGRVILDDAEAVAAHAAAIVVATGAARPAVGIMLAGGSTPRRTYERVAAAGTAFAGVDVWFGDERMGPPDHADSNHGMAARAWLAASAARVHRIRGELGAEAAARRAADELAAHAGADPRLDLVLLGVGADGHTASLFPGDPAIAAGGLYAPAQGGARVTATAALLARARRVIVLATGAGKAEVCARILGGKAPALPAAIVAGPTAGDHVTWILDRAAAAALC
jgi:6-phosphogluconolactonase